TARPPGQRGDHPLGSATLRRLTGTERDGAGRRPRTGRHGQTATATGGPRRASRDGRERPAPGPAGTAATHSSGVVTGSPRHHASAAPRPHVRRPGRRDKQGVKDSGAPGLREVEASEHQGVSAILSLVLFSTAFSVKAQFSNSPFAHRSVWSV